MEHPNDKIKTLIETKGEGGYMIVAPSGGKVHPSGRSYELLQGGISAMVTITLGEQESLWELARHFDQMPRAEIPEGDKVNRSKSSQSDGERPGDAFNRTATWEDTGLFDNGWTRAYSHGGTTYLRKPGKRRDGISATINHNGSDKFYCFSTATVFEAERNYSKFGVYTKLNHNDDFAAAASELSKRGYGERPTENQLQRATSSLPPAADDQGDETTSESVQPAQEEPKEARKSQATQLVELAHKAGIELWHTPEGVAYASFVVSGHIEHVALRTKGFRGWLARSYYAETHSSPGAQALQDALGVLEGQALYEGEEYQVCVRIAEHQGSIYLDLVNADWQVIEITKDGWQVVDRSPIRFRRSAGMLPLPTPKRGGSINEFRPFANVATDYDWALLLAWLISILRPDGPKAHLILTGEQGSAKSTLGRLLRSLVDPNTAPLRKGVRNDRDLMITARNSWVIAFDNLSSLPAWLSDALCCLSTGGGYATRELYADSEEVIFEAMRPALLTSIEDVVERADLLDRSVLLTLQPVPERKRRALSEFLTAFELVRPRILGALLDAAAVAIRNLPTVKLAGLPRMADFASWAVAAETALGLQQGTFIQAYSGNRADAHELALDSLPIIAPLRQFMDKQLTGIWHGPAGDLLKELLTQGNYDEKKHPPEGWPKRGDKLSGQLKRAAPNLRQSGLDVQFGRSGSKGRTITIRKVAQSSVTGDVGDTATHEKGGLSDATSKVSDASFPKGDATFGASDATSGMGDASDARFSTYSNGSDVDLDIDLDRVLSGEIDLDDLPF